MNGQLQRMLRQRVRRKLTARAIHTRGTHPDVETVHPDLPCLPRPWGGSRARSSREAESGAATVAVHTWDVRVLPGHDVRRGDLLEVTVSRDPSMVGRYLVVLDVPADEWAALRHVVCQESRLDG